MLVGKGAVESVRSRENGYVVGVRVKPFCVQHFLLGRRLKVGELVEVFNDPNHGYEIRETK